VAGSLLTVPSAVALMSWKRWGELQPEHGSNGRGGGLDLGPIFSVEPFRGVRVVRAVLASTDWHHVVETLATGKITLPTCHCSVVITDSTSTVLLSRDGSHHAHWVVQGAKRPVMGVVATLNAPSMPPTEAIWQLATPPYLERGPDLGAMFTHRHLVHWIDGLVGVDWPAGGDVLPPQRLVIGRPQSRAWITCLKPNYDDGTVIVSIGWDEQVVDAPSCSLVVRSERDGMPTLVRHQRIADLPGKAVDPEPRLMSWQDRMLNVAVPRGPRRTPWGVALLGPQGELLDECPVAPRAERISMTFRVAGSSAPGSVSTVGDPNPPPSDAERDEAVVAAARAEAETRKAAAHRRISTVGELASYLQWRFSCRDGELLLLDPGLFRQKRHEEVVSFLAGFDRRIRALVSGVPELAREALASAPNLSAKPLLGGKKDLHDRIWIVGETAVLVGASPGDFLADPQGPRPAMTASDPPCRCAPVARALRAVVGGNSLDRSIGYGGNRLSVCQPRMSTRFPSASPVGDCVDALPQP
jgi:hypothetical protein